jgi:protein involved in ribonucleotide reduction
VKSLGYLQAPVVVTDEDHWSGFRPDKIDELAARLASRGARSHERRHRDRAPLLVYFSSVSGNTARFIEKLGSGAAHPAAQHRGSDRGRRAVRARHPDLRGQGRGVEKGAVPKQVIRFLNDERNRHLIRGVISAGNTNFGERSASPATSSAASARAALVPARTFRHA